MDCASSQGLALGKCLSNQCRSCTALLSVVVARRHEGPDVPGTAVGRARSSRPTGLLAPRSAVVIDNMLLVVLD